MEARKMERRFEILYYLNKLMHGTVMKHTRTKMWTKIKRNAKNSSKEHRIHLNLSLNLYPERILYQIQKKKRKKKKKKNI